MSNKHSNQAPSKAFKLGFINWFTLLVMSCAGVVAVYLHSKQNGPVEPEVSAPVETPKEDITEDSAAIVYASDLDSIIAQSKSMISAQNSIAIFEHGSCVLIIEPVANPIQSAKSSLQILSSPNIEFEVKPLSNNNYLIVFNKYLFCFLFAKDIAPMKQAIMSDSRLNISKDDSSYIRDLSELERRLGKLSRLFLIADAKSLTIKKIMKAAPAKIKQTKKPRVEKE